MLFQAMLFGWDTKFVGCFPDCIAGKTNKESHFIISKKIVRLLAMVLQVNRTLSFYFSEKSQVLFPKTGHKKQAIFNAWIL